MCTANVEQLAIVIFVPKELQSQVSLEDWIAAVVTPMGGEVVSNNGTLAKCLVKADIEKQRFPIKMRDEATGMGFAFLRSRSLVPEDDSDDDVNMGELHEASGIEW